LGETTEVPEKEQRQEDSGEGAHWIASLILRKVSVTPSTTVRAEGNTVERLDDISCGAARRDMSQDARGRVLVSAERRAMLLAEYDRSVHLWSLLCSLGSFAAISEQGIAGSEIHRQI